jgi:hypothetical protein
VDGQLSYELDFFDDEIKARKEIWIVDKSYILWCHDRRNEQSQGGYQGVPEKQVLDIARRAALWIFGLLFGVSDSEERLTHALAEKLPPPLPERNAAYDVAIDGAYDAIDIGGQAYRVSEVLYSTDYDAYRDLGIELSQMQRQRASPLMS